MEACIPLYASISSKGTNGEDAAARMKYGTVVAANGHQPLEWEQETHASASRMTTTGCFIETDTV